MKAIICVGISASGKSTFAREMERQGYIDVNRDWIRFNIVCPGTDWSSYKFTRSRENEVTRIQENMISDYAEEYDPIIISDTNLNPKTRNRLVDLCTSLGYEVEIKEFPITLEEAWKRDSLRTNGVGHAVIYKQYKQWLEYKDRKTYVPDNSLPRAVIVDIDGTLATHKGIRGSYEWHKVGEDKPRLPIIDMVNSLHMSSDVIERIIIVSGRDNVCRYETEIWIEDYLIDYDELHMRPEGDMRKDTVVKEEIFWNHIAPNYNVVSVIDDRPSVVRMWHEIGIENVICVGNPWEEF